MKKLLTLLMFCASAAWGGTTNTVTVGYPGGTYRWLSEAAAVFATNDFYNQFDIQLVGTANVGQVSFTSAGITPTRQYPLRIYNTYMTTGFLTGASWPYTGPHIVATNNKAINTTIAHVHVGGVMIEQRGVAQIGIQSTADGLTVSNSMIYRSGTDGTIGGYGIYVFANNKRTTNTFINNIFFGGANTNVQCGIYCLCQSTGSAATMQVNAFHNSVFKYSLGGIMGGGDGFGGNRDCYMYTTNNVIGWPLVTVTFPKKNFNFDSYGSGNVYYTSDHETSEDDSASSVALAPTHQTNVLPSAVWVNPTNNWTPISFSAICSYGVPLPFVPVDCLGNARAQNPVGLIDSGAVEIPLSTNAIAYFRQGIASKRMQLVEIK